MLSSAVHEVTCYLNSIRSMEVVMIITRITVTMAPAATAGATSETPPK